jgi:hypothetical protein
VAIITSRRSFITGLVALVAAPAIVRAGSLMPVKVMEPDWIRKQVPIATLNGVPIYADATFPASEEAALFETGKTYTLLPFGRRAFVSRELVDRYLDHPALYKLLHPDA